MDRGTNGGGAGVSFEDQRALQLAFELSMLGIPEGSSGCPGTGTGNGTTNDPDPLQTAPAVFEEARSKKSQNMTECVPVPSSEHVAEIVGRQVVFRIIVHTRPISRRNSGLKFVFSPQAPALLSYLAQKDRPNNEKLLGGAMARPGWRGGGGDGGAGTAGAAAPVSVVVMMMVVVVVVVVVDAFVGLRSSCRPTPGLSVLMLETRSTFDPREQARKIEKERNTIGRSKRKRWSHAAMREIEIERVVAVEEIKRERDVETSRRGASAAAGTNLFESRCEFRRVASV
ncbi:RNA-binding protein MEX3B [Trachymyrmex cornetzi]|uniref:RNA-binding protein MEX3B n=1 Tax=Trachymyrmex cornetzi TaxID=471704 RepID=A0A195DZE8_9HYME|nr:RNA-binding protein MEX3B [Trachymyrmex cornetzi]